MIDWNVVVSVREGRFILACELLGELGNVKRTGFYNLLVMQVADRRAFLDKLAALIADDASMMRHAISHAYPVERHFTFQDVKDFEAKAAEIALEWAPRLANKSFHVRLHRRGFKGQMSSQQEETFLDGVVLGALERAGTPARMAFEDPDAVLDVQTLGNHAGMAIWSREDLARYPFLHID